MEKTVPGEEISFFADGTSHSKGTLILIKQGLDFRIRATHKDDSGNFIMLDALFQDCPFCW